MDDERIDRYMNAHFGAVILVAILGGGCLLSLVIPLIAAWDPLIR